MRFHTLKTYNYGKTVTITEEDLAMTDQKIIAFYWDVP
jgi:hypothetical protein